MKAQRTGLRGLGAAILALGLLGACSGEAEPAEESEQALRACVRRQPAVRLSPRASSPVTHGTTVTYTLSLTNRDNLRCSPAQILFGEWESPDRLRVELSTGSSLQFIELAPHESMDLEVRVTSLVDSPPGALRFQIAAVNFTDDQFLPLGALVEKSVKVQGVYRLIGEPPCQRRPPSFSVTPSVGPAVPLGTTVSYEARVVNNDSGECPPQTFHYGVPPMQWGVMSPPPPGINVVASAVSSIAPGAGTFSDVPAGGSAVGTLQVFSGPPLAPGITEFPIYLTDIGLQPLATASVGYHLAETLTQ